MKHGNWTVVFPDKRIIKKTDDFNIETGRGYVIDDDAFWNQSKFSNLNAIQFTDDNTDNDQVEYSDTSPNGSYDANVLGNFSQFIEKFDVAHLAQIQAEWDADVLTVDNENFGEEGELALREETTAEQITRKGPRPTSYSS
jgi:hypothetical protein